MTVLLTLEEGTNGTDYLSALDRAGVAGSEIVALRPGAPAPESFDGLLLSGGGDVDPRFYGQEPVPGLRGVDRARDQFELSLVARCRRAAIPIFGICRGLQVLNVAFGGTLVQDIPSQRPSEVAHDVRRAKDFLAHEVRAGESELRVNSRHHQAIDRLGRGLRATARSPEGLVEALEGPGEIFAVQWHPENLVDAGPAGPDLFSRFAAACRGRRPLSRAAELR
jgi:putative glutamine amidotransferase